MLKFKGHTSGLITSHGSLKKVFSEVVGTLYVAAITLIILFHK